MRARLRECRLRPQHCGDCNNACACNGQCVNVDNDPDHCGQCGMNCPDVCGNGQCIDNCDGFPDECNGACTDVDVDPLNCGDCGQACQADELCVNRNCESFFASPCNQCPCNQCQGGMCCFSDFADADICIDAPDCP
ncbi:hypothetical protein [Nannocystis pusilla]|uniref:hypothetical protein n=1 Tax=Nannocystis pusilla TaxID=889268 RepID=UPI003BF1B2D8